MATSITRISAPLDDRALHRAGRERLNAAARVRADIEAERGRRHWLGLTDALRRGVPELAAELTGFVPALPPAGFTSDTSEHVVRFAFDFHHSIDLRLCDGDEWVWGLDDWGQEAEDGGPSLFRVNRPEGAVYAARLEAALAIAEMTPDEVRQAEALCERSLAYATDGRHDGPILGAAAALDPAECAQ